jgi:hypothetical protein
MINDRLPPIWNGLLEVHYGQALPYDRAFIIPHHEPNDPCSVEFGWTV